MTVTNTGAFFQAPRRGGIKCVAAKTTYSDNTNAVTLLSAGPNGSRVDSLGALPLATVTATQVVIYDTDGTTVTPIASGTVAAFTITQISQLPPTTINKADGSGAVSPTNPITLPLNHTLLAGIGVANATGIAVMCDGWDL